MWLIILIVASVILLCIVAERFSDKLGMPALIAFMFIGMLFGSDGLFKIPFDDFKIAEAACSTALIFIMFYGGFNTKWSAAKKVAGKSIALATGGVVLTALITTGLCMAALKMSFAESFLIGSVLASTDAASVFAILRKNKLNLKDGTASILEVESGSNDPVAYLLTLVAINLLTAGDSGNLALTMVFQMAFGILMGVIFAKVSMKILDKSRLVTDMSVTVFIIAMVLLCFSVTTYVNGNAYLSVYLYGIILGNKKVRRKRELIGFFDGVTSLAQIFIFFLIGLLTFPSQMPQIISTALIVFAILTLVARPIAVFAILLAFRCSLRQCLLIAWAGLRGAASSVFAIMAVANGVPMQSELFHIVFMVSLFSVSIQGTLLPWFAKMTEMVDESSDVRKTFNDYQDEDGLDLMKLHIPQGHRWADNKVKDIVFPPETLALMVNRGNDRIIPNGNTDILQGDDIILGVPKYTHDENDELSEKTIEEGDPWCDKPVEELKLDAHTLIVMINRDGQKIIPDGQTRIREGDVVVIFE